ncbi:MAG: hypothetical protein ABJA02_14805 [Acidobacteriota bacterium]
MDKTEKLEKKGKDLFDRYKDDITPACERAVRDALLMHKLAGNPVAVSQDGKVVLLQPEEIEID